MVCDLYGTRFRIDRHLETDLWRAGCFDVLLCKRLCTVVWSCSLPQTKITCSLDISVGDFKLFLSGVMRAIFSCTRLLTAAKHGFPEIRPGIGTNYKSASNPTCSPQIFIFEIFKRLCINLFGVIHFSDIFFFRVDYKTYKLSGTGSVPVLRRCSGTYHLE